MSIKSTTRMSLGSVVVLTALTSWADPTITDVIAQQRYPWNGKVDISYTVSGDIAAHCHENGLINPTLKVSATDMVADTVYTATATALDGDMALTDGTHTLVWDLDADGLSIQSSNVVFNVSCEVTEALYCVIDLSGGANATNYPVAYLATEPSEGFNVDAYKTTKLVLRRLAAGSFIMGDNQADETHRVTLTKPFYMGLFEVTQKQWSLVMGSNPCSSTSYGKGDTYPVHYVSYNMIRGSSSGAGWPESSAVDATSFLGKLQAKTGLNVDLPTEAQWEYACRAGTATTYYWGNSMDGNYAWYSSNSGSKAHPAGGKTPNAWGLYDMTGNVWEWCLDWYGSLAYGMDPKGSSSGSGRVLRGGSWYVSESYCTSSYRGSNTPSYTSHNDGFRLSRTLP